ncbi:MAG: hypothetical protein ACR2QK_04745 [Acidimicrobiales bacterium]
MTLVPNPTIAVNPSQDSVDALSARPDDDAIIMVNLLRYAPEGGREAYARYGAVAGGVVRARGGGPVYSAPVVVGDSPWETVLLVRYPRRAAYLDMQTDPAYLGVIPERTRGLSARLLYSFHPAAGDPEDTFRIERSGGDEVFVVELVRLAAGARSGDWSPGGQVILRLQADSPMVTDDRWDELVVTRYPSIEAAGVGGHQAAGIVEDRIRMVTKPER